MHHGFWNVVIGIVAAQINVFVFLFLCLEGLQRTVRTSCAIRLPGFVYFSTEKISNKGSWSICFVLPLSTFYLLCLVFIKQKKLVKRPEHS